METNAARVARHREAIAELQDKRRVAVEEAEAFRGRSWELIERMARARLQTLQEQLVRSDDPEPKIRQLQGEARTWDKVVEMPRLADVKIKAIEDKMRTNESEIQRLETR